MKFLENWTYKCDMLVDQDRYIGNDPIGYKCGNDAKFVLDKIGFLMCADCFKLYKTDQDRLRFPSVGGKKYQEDMLRQAVKELRGQKYVDVGGLRLPDFNSLLKH